MSGRRPPPPRDAQLVALHAAAVALAALLALLAACSSPAAPPAPSAGPPAARTGASRAVPSSPEVSSPPAPPPAASPAPWPAPPARTRYVLAAIGDSLSDPRSHGGGYLDVLRERCPESRFETFGVGGNMVNMMRRRLLRDVFGEGEGGRAAERPAWTHVLVFGGLGDVLSNLTARRTARAVQADLAEMVRLSRARGAKAIVLTTHPWAGSRDYDAVRAAMARDINAWIVEAGRSGEIDLTFDTRPVLSCGDLERLCAPAAAPDRLHLSAAGQRTLGEALFEALFADCR